MDFNFDKLTDVFNSGLVKRVEGLWDTAHNGKPEHIDLHVFTTNGGIKYSNLSNVESLKDNCPWLNPGDRFVF
jgi:hypothetical protein